MLSPRLQLKVAQKQILTPGLVQMVTVLQLNRLELKEMINQEIVDNPVLDDSLEAGEEITPEELQPLLEGERSTEQADKELLESAHIELESEAPQVVAGANSSVDTEFAPEVPEATEAPDSSTTDPFDEIDFGSFFDDYLDPGYKSPASESVEKPSFETFLSAPQTLPDYLRSQLSVILIDDETRDAAESIIGNLDEDGYLTATMDEMTQQVGTTQTVMETALKAVQSLDPAGVGARDLRECLLLQLESKDGKGGVAWQIISGFMRLLETRQLKELAKAMGRPQEHIDIAVAMIRRLNPRPGIRDSGAGARTVEPDVYYIRDGDDFIIQMNDDDLPQPAPERAVPQDARPRQRRHQGSARLRARALFVGHPADEEHRAAQADHPESLRSHQAPPDGISRDGHRVPQADDDQGRGRRSRSSPLHREPRRRQQIRPHSSWRLRTAILLLRGGAGTLWG